MAKAGAAGVAPPERGRGAAVPGQADRDVAVGADVPPAAQVLAAAGGVGAAEVEPAVGLAPQAGLHRLAVQRADPPVVRHAGGQGAAGIADGPHGRGLAGDGVVEHQQRLGLGQILEHREPSVGADVDGDLEVQHREARER
ncbi:MAG: hypothetical protein IPL61_18060 [Myxococcales bacterium]|nr:hypothetical protein [Myxococcales bacterium]